MIKNVLAFMLPDDIDYHTDEDGNVLWFNNLDELHSYLIKEHIPIGLVHVFDVYAEEE